LKETTTAETKFLDLVLMLSDVDPADLFTAALF
jgi:hypothetical protein